ncbi:UDP-N-acetylmuramyl pentapeptide phosphotransferase [Microbacterium mangrovi]|uniref:UDP-N-acetylmuramyl pentapeptide phosphotransferase n=1 Tax=Microbacterium mangrovi TaxID=1348253 RepID=A0A0B2A6J9_9MICO|nr:MraY family glycosyltransferase [Microbacterium mangrovi]KHK98695.1 UDP-N-acetylmuramyl pentapeptide phosphotransferase [Microbacterium mangrovi]
MKQYLFTVLLTATVTLVLSWSVWQIALKFKLYPGIRARDVHTTPTPRLGGIAVFLGIAASMAVSAGNPYFSIIWSDPQQMIAILAAMTLTVLVGVADDIWDLDWFIKLGAQFLAAGIVVGWGQLQLYALPIGGMTVISGPVGFAISVLAIVVVMNAVNFIDGLDGLLTGVCLIANAIFFVYSYLLVRDIGASTYFNLASFLAATLVGACAGFLPLNWSKAKMFMGDAGALLIGLLMATSALAITAQWPTVTSEDLGRSQLLGAFIPILLPIAVVILPLIDFGSAVVRRLWAGKSPFSPDRKHLHHRMLDMGHSDRAAVLIFYAWTAIIGLAVLLMYLASRQGWPGAYWIGVAYGVVGAAACLVVTISPRKRRSRKRVPRPEAAL